MNSAKILFTIIFFFFFRYAIFADVYLLTDHEGVGHSILVVIERDSNNNIKKLTSLSKQPPMGLDDTIVLENGQTLSKYKNYGSDPLFNVQTQEGFIKRNDDGDILYNYTGIKLSIENGSEMEQRVLQEIAISSEENWITNNCGQATYDVLSNAGYFSKNVEELMHLWEGDWFLTGLNSPEYTERWVKTQEDIYASKKRSEVEKDEKQTQSSRKISKALFYGRV